MKKQMIISSLLLIFAIASVQAEPGSVCKVDYIKTIKGMNTFGDCKKGDILEIPVTIIAHVCDFDSAIVMGDKSDFVRSIAFCVYRGEVRGNR